MTDQKGATDVEILLRREEGTTRRTEINKFSGISRGWYLVIYAYSSSSQKSDLSTVNSQACNSNIFLFNQIVPHRATYFSGLLPKQPVLLRFVLLSRIAAGAGLGVVDSLLIARRRLLLEVALLEDVACAAATGMLSACAWSARDTVPPSVIFIGGSWRRWPVLTH